jgi:hypothetical protein
MFVCAQTRFCLSASRPLLSIEVYDPVHSFTFASAIGPVKFEGGRAINFPHYLNGAGESEYIRVLAIDEEKKSAAVVTNPFCAARESWEGWEFENMQQYFEALNRPHPDGGEKAGPRLVVRMVLTNTATGRSEVIADLSPTFEVRSFWEDWLNADVLTCTGQWGPLGSPGWGGSVLQVRVALRAEADPEDVAAGIPEHEREYYLASGSYEDMFVELQFKLA